MNCGQQGITGSNNPNPDNPNQGTTYNPRCLSDKASLKTMLDNQDSQGTTTNGAGKPEPKILTHNHSLIIDNTTYASGKAPDNTSPGTQASNVSRNPALVLSVTCSKGNILNERNPSTRFSSNTQCTTRAKNH